MEWVTTFYGLFLLLPALAVKCWTGVPATERIHSNMPDSRVTTRGRGGPSVTTGWTACSGGTLVALALQALVVVYGKSIYHGIYSTQKRAHYSQ